MKRVLYNGHSYEYRVSEKDGIRLVSLYEKGVLRYNLKENDLDSRTLVSLILDSYYSKEAQKETQKPESGRVDPSPTTGKIYTHSIVRKS